jgi:flagellar biosynthesis/type III secretory pathway protein FliH
VSAQDFALILKSNGPDARPQYEIRDLAALSAGAEAPAEPDRFREAYERGVAEGLKQGQAETAALLERQGQLLTALIQELQVMRDSLLRDAEEPVAGLAFEIARKVIHEQAPALRDVIVAQAKDAIAKVREGGPVKVLVHPHDAPVLEEAREAVATAFEGSVTLQVEPDPRISRGGCLVETPVRLVDARIEAQLARIAEALKQKGRKPEGPDVR